MKKIFSVVVLCFVVFILNAQNFSLTLFGGLANYQGDLQNKVYTLNQSHPAFGAGLLYDITNKLALRANVTMGSISGDDKYNSKNTARNLNFKSPITDIHLGVEYTIFDLTEKHISPFIFAGISHFNFNPYTRDLNGNKYYLQPLSTEGQGFYANRVKYSLSQFALPFGGGLKYALNENLKISVEVGMRKTNTDYLDDVSTDYVDQTLLFNNRGQKAVDLAFRGNEINATLTYPNVGDARGNPKVKDWYYFSGITLSIRIAEKSEGGGSSKGKSRTGCPTNVY